MKNVLKGITEFQTELRKQPHPWLSPALMTAQQPEVLMVTCSDSRLLPNAITNTKPGYLFLVRNAGNLLPAAGVGSAEEGTIEYGLRVLGIRHLVVCGHTCCGAMTSLVTSNIEQDDSAIGRWLRNASEVRQWVDERHADEPEQRRVRLAIEKNVLVQLAHARSYPAVKWALEHNDLQLHAWVNDIETAMFYNYDERLARYTDLVTVDEASS